MNDPAAQVMPVVVPLPAEIDVTNSAQVYNRLVAALAPGVRRRDRGPDVDVLL